MLKTAWFLVFAVCLMYLSVLGQTTNFTITAVSETDSTASASTTASTTGATTEPPHDEERHIEYEGFDGWYNNRAHPEYGAAETPLMRRLPARYEDGVYEPSGRTRPNPLDISNTLMDGPTGRPSYRNRTALLVFFGQQVVEEVLDAQGAGCPREYFNIEIPKGHSLYDPDGAGGKQMPFLRTRFDMRTGLSPNNPRQQLNEISTWIDGTLMYGPNKAWTDGLRKFEDGLLLATNDSDDNSMYFPAVNTIRLPMANPPPPRDHALKNVNRFFRIGNPRGNENPFLLTMGVMWFRFHNYKARQLKKVHTNWDDEKLFNEARKWVIATHQKIIAYDWLPSWIGEDENGQSYGLPTYSGYKPQVDPGIAHVFQSAAMRYGHTLVPPGVYRRNAQCEFRKTTGKTGVADQPALRTCNTYWNPQESIQESDIDELLMGMASQVAEREDHIITPDLRGHVFGPLEFSRRDLMALNIQRGRDHGLPDYNTARREYNLEPVKNWENINSEVYQSSAEFRNIIWEFRNLYNNRSKAIDDIDIWAGGLLETTPRGPGELFRTIILDQFTRIRDGDRFWFENYKLNGLFTKTEIDELWNTTLYDIITAVTNIPENAIQRNPFFFKEGDPCAQEAQLKAQDMENCTTVKYFDYFAGSEASYILTFIAVGLFLIACVGMLFCLAHVHQIRLDKAKGKNKKEQKKKPSNKRHGGSNGMDQFQKTTKCTNYHQETHPSYSNRGSTESTNHRFLSHWESDKDFVRVHVYRPGHEVTFDKNSNRV